MTDISHKSFFAEFSIRPVHTGMNLITAVRVWNELGLPRTHGDAQKIQKGPLITTFSYIGINDNKRKEELCRNNFVW